ncbi:MAG: hypothetical protein A2015_07195 [Spirochaetes bacterium GWF1_31_7]|nr:MAG: hypothetical protein A2Y30_02575 [Spirochaetes bacterium GWE1_32_154]OHD46822.1 MAG: hypothetical protein A2Y29_09810 [Spirochaetes bacterium GWE2_31_10]OHD51205.1 MAG: hypothetical protein A2015_07195 [Spirochaetes bacterium GWF1_31_7]HBD95649.1 hypothetical protein [Spirochaetia bacterium]HBI37441.1 hypothetical protein [Spirochaetia bacterium]
MKQYIAFIFIIALFISGCADIFQKVDQNVWEEINDTIDSDDIIDKTKPAISIKYATLDVLHKGTIDFGDVTVDVKKEVSFSINNDSDKPLTITSCTVNNGIFSVSTMISNKIIPAKTNFLVTIGCTPPATGVSAGILTIISDAGNVPSFEINLTGKGVTTDITKPTISIKQATVDVPSGGMIEFGDTDVGATKNIGLTIVNTSTKVLTIASVSTSVNLFTIVGLAGGATIQPNSIYNFSLEYKPIDAGTNSAAFTITSDADTPSLSFNLTGTGVIPVTKLQVLVDGSVKLDNDVVDFGTVVMSAFKDVTIDFKNSDVSSLITINSFTDISANGFTFTPLLPWGISGGSSKMITFTFTAGPDPMPPPVDVAVTFSYTEGSISRTFTLNFIVNKATLPQPLAYYAFEDTFNDSTVNAKHLTNMGAVSFDIWGKKGKTAKFAGGANDYLENLDLMPAGTYSDITVTMWVNTTSTATQRIFNIKGNYSTSYSVQRRLSIISSNAIEGYISNAYNPTPANVITTNAWHHLAAVWKTSDGINYINEIYVNGELKATKTTTTEPNSNGNMRLGWDYFGGSMYYYIGKLDEVRIYNSALTLEQINADKALSP